MVVDCVGQSFPMQPNQVCSGALEGKDHLDPLSPGHLWLEIVEAASIPHVEAFRGKSGAHRFIGCNLLP